MFVVCCALFIVCCLLVFDVVCCSLLALCVVRRSLFVVFCVLHVGRCC